MTWFRRNKPPARAASPRPAPGTAPVPGQHLPPEVRPSPPWGHVPAPAGPAREPAPGTAPAPGPLPSRHGGTNISTRLFWCGRYIVWDGSGGVIFFRGCKCPVGADWHQWEKELTS